METGSHVYRPNILLGFPGFEFHNPSYTRLSNDLLKSVHKKVVKQYLISFVENSLKYRMNYIIFTSSYLIYAYF